MEYGGVVLFKWDMEKNFIIKGKYVGVFLYGVYKMEHSPIEGICGGIFMQWTGFVGVFMYGQDMCEYSFMKGKRICL